MGRGKCDRVPEILIKPKLSLNVGFLIIYYRKIPWSRIFIGRAVGMEIGKDMVQLQRRKGNTAAVEIIGIEQGESSRRIHVLQFPFMGHRKANDAIRRIVGSKRNSKVGMDSQAIGKAIGSRVLHSNTRDECLVGDFKKG